MNWLVVGMCVAIGWKITTYLFDILETMIGYKVLEWKLGHRKVKGILDRERTRKD